jgi:hypothetical protein
MGNFQTFESENLQDMNFDLGEINMDLDCEGLLITTCQMHEQGCFGLPIIDCFHCVLVWVREPDYQTNWFGHQSSHHSGKSGGGDNH